MCRFGDIFRGCIVCRLGNVFRVGLGMCCVQSWGCILCRLGDALCLGLRIYSVRV